MPVALAAWGAALTAVMAPSAAPAVALTLWGFLAAALSVAGVSRATRTRMAGRVVAVAVLAVAIAGAAASHVAIAQPTRDAVLTLPVGGGRAIAVDATVVGKIERRSDGSLAFDALATDIRTGRDTHPVAAPIVIVVAPGDVDDRGTLDVGSAIEARGSAREGRPGERAVLEVRASRGVTVLVPPHGALAAAASLRQGLVTSVEGLPEPGAGLIPGLAVGDTAAVGDHLDAAMKESSLSHLTAVSGANCALVVGIVYLVAAALGARRGMRVLAGVAGLVGFVVLVTPEPSVVRAAVMAAIAMVALLLGRTGAGIGILSLTVAVLLAADPWLATSLGFALSVVATASLLLLARPLAAGLARRVPMALALALSVPLAAQLACGPLLVLITPAVPVYGVAANLLAAPAAPAATILGLAACLAGPIPVLRDGLAALAWLPASWIAGTATSISALPADRLPWLEGWGGAVALGAVGGAVAVVIAVHPGRAVGRRAVRGAALVTVAITVGVATGGSVLGTVAGRFTLPPAWTVLACDVGQGDAVLVRSAGAVALVDTGPDPADLAECLDRVGVSHIDLLVLTHFDLDHVGGIEALYGRVSTVLHGPAYGPADRMLGHLESAGAHLVVAHTGITGTVGGATWSVLWPLAESRAFPSGNDASVVVDIRGGGVPPTLLLGDLSAAPQRVLAASGAMDAPYAIVKVAHHGSADQEPALYLATAPTIAIVTVGADNDYGHPRDETLEMLRWLGARILRTDLDGIVAVSAAGDGWELWRERGTVGPGG